MPGKPAHSSSFVDFLQEALHSVDQLQKEADVVTEAFVLGQKPVEIHDVMIATERAQLALDLTVAIRNKLVEAYQEIMRMQV